MVFITMWSTVPTTSRAITVRSILMNQRSYFRFSLSSSSRSLQ